MFVNGFRAKTSARLPDSSSTAPKPPDASSLRGFALLFATAGILALQACQTPTPAPQGPAPGSRPLPPPPAPAAPAPAVISSTSFGPIPGLAAPVDILIDTHGIPHIYARSIDDLYLAQGFMAARDRLWQMDLWRKRGLGHMAKDFGPEWVEQDAAARSVLFNGDMYREWLAYGSDAKRIAEHFAAGVNAFIAKTESDAKLLPVEFRTMGYRPEKWKAEDIVRIRHHGLTLNFTSEVERAQAYCGGAQGARADWLRRELVPPITPKVPEGFEPCTLPADALKKAYKAATDAPVFTKANAKVAKAAEADSGYGSNNWTISPALTSTGRPILANDPHRAHGAPSLRYISHLSAPGLDVIGAGEPFLPGISIGHNGHIAFGLTRFYMDQEDLYVYDLNPANPEEYRYQGRWEAMQPRVEAIEVKGEAQPRQMRMLFTRHGPVLAFSGDRRKAFALRAAWLDLGMAPYFGSMDYIRAKNWNEFRSALYRWGAPGENQVYADKEGNIGWIAGGLTPIRPNWDGLMPVPGDGRYEWAGYRNGDELPAEFNPKRGYVVTANENNIPPGSPAWNKGIGYEWSDSARARRLKALFESKARSGARFTLDDSERMQTDIVSSQAQRYIALLAPLKSSDSRTQQGLGMLQRWNGSMDKDSAAAALYEIWSARTLRKAVLDATLDAKVRPFAGPGDASRVLELMERPGQDLSRAKRDELLLSTIAPAMDEAGKLMGSDPAGWKWGALHRAEFRHRFANVVPADLKSKLDVGDWPISGSAFTPMATSYVNANAPTPDFRLTAGASFRMVLDVGDWDASRVVNTPGQSGDPDSPHYRDLAPLWANGQYFPLPYSRKAVEAVTAQRLKLEAGEAQARETNAGGAR